MFLGKKIVCIIPARSGSKGLKNKNIAKLLNKPLIYFAIKQALASKFIDKIVFSTDSRNYANICEKIGLKVNSLRAKKYALDNSLDIDLFKYEILKLKKKGFNPDIFVNLRPTSPIRTHLEIDNCLKKLINNTNADSIRSICKNNFAIQKNWFIEGKLLRNVVNKSFNKQEWDMPRQKLEPSYMQTGSIDIGRVNNIMSKNSMTGNKILPFIQKFNCDIDNQIDLIEAENIAKKSKKLDRYL